jgi:hypothetical protein
LSSFSLGGLGMGCNRYNVKEYCASIRRRCNPPNQSPEGPSASEAKTRRQAS